MRYQLVPAREQDKAWLEQLRRSVYQGLFIATWGAWDETRHLRHCEGTRLLRDTIAQARAVGKKVSLSTGLKNRRAFDLYVRLGFRHVGQTDTHDLLELEPAEPRGPI